MEFFRHSNIFQIKVRLSVAARLSSLDFSTEYLIYIILESLLERQNGCANGKPITRAQVLFTFGNFTIRPIGV